ncbi:MAG TPA: histidine kinase [Pseudonocardiaceae bacterium]|jgi:signal transduction histidine kinase
MAVEQGVTGGLPVRSSVWPLALLAAAGAVFGALVLTMTASGRDAAATTTQFSASVGGLYLIAGVIATARQPRNRIALLLVAVGIGWFAEDLQVSIDPLVHSAGLLVRSASMGFLVHLLLTFPSGTTHSRIDRGLTATGYLMVFGIVPLSALSLPSLTPNLLLAWPLPFQTVQRIIDGIQLAMGAAVVAVLARRWVLASAPARRVLAPVFGAGLVGGAASVLDAMLGTGPSWSHRVLIAIAHVAMLALPVAFLAGVWRVRLGRTSVADLLVRLSGSPPTQLRDLLAKALGDPSLRIGYTRPDQDNESSYIDSHGRPLEVPPGSAVTAVRRDGRQVAVLMHDPALREDRHVLEAVTSAAALELDNQRLAAEVRAQLVEVRASRARIVAAGDEQRRRVERDLHDGAQQRLVTVALTLRLARQRMERGTTPDDELAELLRRSADGLEDALAELRELARGIHPSVLNDLGLLAALRALAARSPQPVELTAPALPDLPAPIAATAYFVAAEAVTNALKHAGAQHIHIDVRLDTGLRLAVLDDGVGGADLAAGTGLLGLRDRVSAVDGTLTVRSAPGTGTTVTARLPVVSA